MKKLAPEIVDHYDGEVVRMIAEKYGYSPMEALRQFVISKTHELLEDEETILDELLRVRDPENGLQGYKLRVLLRVGTAYVDTKEVEIKVE